MGHGRGRRRQTCAPCWAWPIAAASSICSRSCSRGDTGERSPALDALHRDGAEPAQVLADLAEAVHVAARAKAARRRGRGRGPLAEEKRRAAALGERLSTALLSRAWQMLLKGLEGGREGAESGGGRRDGADPPRLYGGPAAARRDHPIARRATALALAGAKPPPRDSGGARTAPLDRAAETVPSAASPQQAAAAPADDEDAAFDPEYEASLGDIVPDDDAPAVPVRADPRSFAEVVALAGERREAKLKVHLEEHVSLVKFDRRRHHRAAPAAGRAPGARQRAAREAQRLDRATLDGGCQQDPGRAAARRGAARARGRRARSMKAHPAVAAVLQRVPRRQDSGMRPAPAAGGRDRHGLDEERTESDREVQR